MVILTDIWPLRNTNNIGVPHKTVSFGHWLTHIRVQHLVLGSNAQDCNTWSRVEPDWTATLLYALTYEILQSDVVQP